MVVIASGYKQALPCNGNEMSCTSYLVRMSNIMFLPPIPNPNTQHILASVCTWQYMEEMTVWHSQGTQGQSGSGNVINISLLWCINKFRFVEKLFQSQSALKSQVKGEIRLPGQGSSHYNICSPPLSSWARLPGKWRGDRAWLSNWTFRADAWAQAFA